MNAKIVSIILVSVISIMLISAVTLTNVDAKKKSNKAQIRIVFTDLGHFKGKVQVTLTNDDRKVKLFSQSVSLKKDNKETIKFEAKNSKVGDHLTLRITAITLQGSHGGWNFPEHFQKSMNEQSAALSEIDCGGEC